MDQSTTLAPNIVGARDKATYLPMQPSLPDLTPQWEQDKAKQQRQDDTSWTQQAGAMWRQDGIIDGLIGYTVGSQMVPDANYSPYNKAEWEDLTQGVAPEYHQEFHKATSGAHARFIKDRLMQKQEDLVKLGDLGVAGNVARFAFGAVQPENLISGGAGFLVSRALQGAKLVNAANKATNVVEQATNIAGARAAIAQSRTGIKGIASGMAVSGASEGAFEKLRQSVNFEDDGTAIVEAALIGSMFTLPFELAGARAATRAANAAKMEHKTLQLLNKRNNGEEFDEADLKHIQQMDEAAVVAKQAEDGDITVVEARERMDRLRNEQIEDADWLNKFGDDFRMRGEAMLDEMFPDRVNRKTQKIFAPSELLQLGYDPVSIGTASRSTGAPIRMTETGTGFDPNTQSLSDPLPAPEGKLSRLELEKAIRAEADKRFPNDQLKREMWAMEQRISLLNSRFEVATPIEAERQRKVFDKSFWSGGKKGAPSKAPDSPVEGLKDASSGDPSVPPSKPVVEAPSSPDPVTPDEPIQVPREAFKEGKVVSFYNPKTEDVLDGVIVGMNDSGWFKVELDNGKVVAVAPIRIQGHPDYKPPAGMVFGKGSVGAAQIGGPLKDISQERSWANKVGSKKYGSIPLRFDFFAILNRSESEKARSLVFQLVKDPLQVDAAEAQGWTASEYKSHIRRTVGGLFFRESVAAMKEAREIRKVPIWGHSSFAEEFNVLVTRATRDPMVLKDPALADIAGAIKRASTAQQTMYGKLLQTMEEMGVKGANEIDPNSMYVNRVWKASQISELRRIHGDDALHDLLAKAINIPGKQFDRATAARFLEVIQKMELNQTFRSIHLAEKDMATLRAELTAANVQPKDIDMIVDTMFEVRAAKDSDAGRAPNLKYRFDIDESLGVNLPTGLLRISDMFENDARVLADSYLNTMGGQIGLAKMGIYSEADFIERMGAVADEKIKKNLSGSVEADMGLLRDIYSNIVGRPMSTHSFDTLSRVASAVRGYTRTVSLGQLGLTAAFEMKQAIGLMGFRAFMQQLPAFNGLITAMRNGYLPDNQLARDMELLTGFGSEKSFAYARAQEIEDGFLGQTLNRVEEWSNKASHAVDIMSGNASFTSLTRQLSSLMATQRLADFAHGRAELTPKLYQRMVGWGVDAANVDSMLADLKKYSTVDPKNGKVESIDYAAWSADSPLILEEFQLVNSRMVRDAIQDQDLGETMPFMHSSLGKMLFELKSFFLVAHAKNMLKNAVYMDQTALHLWAISFLGEMLAYTTQTAMNQANNPEKRAEMLQPDKIALAAFLRSPVSGMVPFFLGEGLAIASGGDIGDLTASGNGRRFIPPSFSAVQRLWAAPSSLVGIAWGDGDTTQKEGQDLFRVLPGSNLYGMRNLGNWLAESLPKSEPKEE